MNPAALQTRRPLTRDDREEMERRGCTPRQIAIAEIRGEGHSEGDAQRILVRRAHGHLCVAISHLFQAAGLLVEDSPEATGIIRHHAGKIAEIIPSYGEFDRATRKPSRAVTST